MLGYRLTSLARFLLSTAMLGHLSGYLFGGASEAGGAPEAAAAAPETVTPCRELHLDDPELDEWVMVAEGEQWRGLPRGYGQSKLTRKLHPTG